ncbi:MAG: hypothetical protein ABIR24_10620 [Verrucomicrobiota bacterium]
MIVLAQSVNGSDPERMVGLLVIIGLVGYVAWAILKKLNSPTISPDPWDESVAAEIEKEDSKPICHRCLTPHDSSSDFCPRCGASVGQYTNWLPYPYLFSLGHMLRVGTSGDFKKTRLNVVGFFLLALVEYLFFAPIYWAVFFFKLSREPVGSKTKQLPKPDSQDG